MSLSGLCLKFLLRRGWEHPPYIRRTLTPPMALRIGVSNRVRVNAIMNGWERDGEMGLGTVTVYRLPIRLPNKSAADLSGSLFSSL